MHTVRVYLNRQEGTTWWAEDDLGFAGAAARLSDLIEKIHDRAECEGLLDDFAVRLVSDPPENPAVNPFSVTGSHVPWSAGTGGVLRVEPAMIAV